MSGFGAAEAWFIAGTIPMLVAGGGHALLTVVDTFRPTYFAPVDESLEPALQSTGIRFRRLLPGGDQSRPSMWHAWLGFNISHGLGVFAFALLCLLIATEEFALIERVEAIPVLAAAVAATYLVVALRFWFWGPVAITATSTVCFSIAAVLA
jgi:hypothetical protein